MKLKNIFFAGAIALLISNTLLGQDALTLSDAIQKGLSQNYDIELERKNVEVSTLNNNWGQAGRYPTLTLNVGQSNNLNDNIKTASPFQIQGPIKSYGLNPTVNLNWTLFNGFKINMTKRRFEQLQAESQGNANIVIANTIQGITLGFLNVVLQQQRMEELEKQLLLSRDKYEYVKVKSNYGGAVASDRLQEEVNYLTDSLSFIAQQLVLRNAIRNLNILMAEPDPDRSWVFPSTIDFENPAYEFEPLREKMLQNNVDLKKQYLTQSVLNTNVGIAKADRYPMLTMNARMGQTRTISDLSESSLGDIPYDPNDPRSIDWSQPQNAVTNNMFAGFTLSFNLYNGGRINRAIKSAVIQEDIGNIRLDKMKLSLDRDLVQTLDQYNIRRQLYDINVRREEVAQTNLELSQEKFRNGSINSFDFRVVQNSYLSSAQLRLAALYSLIESHVALMRLTGGLIETYNESD